MPKSVLDGDASAYISLPGTIPLTDGKLTEKTVTLLRNLIMVLITKVNRLINLGNGVNSTRCGNLDAQNKEVLTPTAGNQFRLQHELNRVVVGFDVTYKDKACDVYADDVASWGKNHCFFKATATNAQITLRLY